MSVSEQELPLRHPDRVLPRNHHLLRVATTTATAATATTATTQSESTMMTTNEDTSSSATAAELKFLLQLSEKNNSFPSIFITRKLLMAIEYSY